MRWNSMTEFKRRRTGIVESFENEKCGVVSAAALIPIPLLKQLRDLILEPRHHLFSIQSAVRPNQPPLFQRIANLYRFRLRIDNPRELGSIGEKIPQSLLDLSPCVIRRQHLHRKIGREAEKLPRWTLEISQAFFRDERDIWRTAILVLHPETGAGIKHGAQLFALNIGMQRTAEPHAYLPMFRIVL